MEGKAVCNKIFRTLVDPAAMTFQAEIAPYSGCHISHRSTERDYISDLQRSYTHFN